MKEKSHNLDLFFRIALGFVIVLLLFPETSFLAVEAEEFKTKKTLLICVDGATWDLMQPLVEKKYLPNIRKLIRNGVSGELLSSPAYSPPSWTTIATGKVPEKHGVNNFSDSRNRKARYIWSILSDFNIRVGVLNWKMALIEKVNGVMYKSSLLWEKRFPDSDIKEYYPDNLEEELKKNVNFIRVPPLYSVELYKTNDAFEKNLINTSRFITNKYQPDFLAIGFHGLGEYQHLYWSAFQPQYFDITLKQAREQGGVITNCYKKIDRYLGYFIKKGYTIIFVSDHGFCRNDAKAGMNIVKIDYKAEVSYRGLLINQMLQKLGVLSSVEMDQEGGRIDFSSAKAYFYNNVKTGLKGIKVNKSIIKQEELDILKERLYLVLSQACFETGENVFVDVRKVTPNKNNDNPDIIIHLNPIFMEGAVVFEDWQGKSTPFQAAFRYLLDSEGRKLTKIILENKEYNLGDFIGSGRSGVHAPQGVVIMSGIGIRKGEVIKNAKTVDITPTIFYLLGLPIAKDMDGKVLMEAIEPEFVKKCPLSSVDTYEAKNKDFYIQDNSGDSIDNYKLRSLGYLQ